MQPREIRDKNVTIVGLARSGKGAANLLAGLGATVTVTDSKAEGELADIIAGLHPSVRLVLGSHPDDVFTGADIIVVSPGVPLDIQPLTGARRKGIPVIGELELAYEVVDSRIEFLAVTGTNGKSTTTALLDFMMKKAGFRTILGGNIGTALTEEISRLMADDMSPMREYDYVVAEVSSFQLESIREFRPKVAAIINITPDHLDRYRSFGDYRTAKAKMFENQRSDDFLVLNRDDSETAKLLNSEFKIQDPKSRVFYFSRRQEVEGIYFRAGEVFCNLPGLSRGPFRLIRAEEIRIKGVHNLENAMAASAMALLAGCPAETVTGSLREFPGLEHRLEFVRELEGVSYFNDSKGTNVDAVMKSLESFSKPVILIAGGRDKAGDFSRLRDLVGQRTKKVVLIGEARGKISSALKGVADIEFAGDLEDAVSISRTASAPGDIVLLSPGCASFDMFVNFEDRGRQFKKIVRGLN